MEFYDKVTTVGDGASHWLGLRVMVTSKHRTNCKITAKQIEPSGTAGQRDPDLSEVLGALPCTSQNQSRLDILVRARQTGDPNHGFRGFQENILLDDQVNRNTTIPEVASLCGGFVKPNRPRHLAVPWPVLLSSRPNRPSVSRLEEG